MRKRMSNRGYHRRVICTERTKEFNKVCNILSEYGRQESFSLAAEAFLLEHGNAMVKENALQELASL